MHDACVNLPILCLVAAIVEGVKRGNLTAVSIFLGQSGKLSPENSVSGTHPPLLFHANGDDVAFFRAVAIAARCALTRTI